MRLIAAACVGLLASSAVADPVEQFGTAMKYGSYG